MAIFKKSLCVILCAFTVALCATVGASAAEDDYVDTYPVGSAFYAIVPQNPTFMTYSNNWGFLPSENGSWGFNMSANEIALDQVQYGVGFGQSTSSSVAYPEAFVQGYTYYFSFTFYFNVLDSEGFSGTNFVYTPYFSGLNRLTYLDFSRPVSNLGYLDHLAYHFHYAGTTSTQNGTHHDNYTGLVSFNVTNVDPVYPLSYFFIKFTKDNLPSSSAPVGFNFRITDCRTYYDPSGDVAEDIESDVSLIIQGQEDAVQYGLDQEQLANEEAYEGAEDAADDASSVFDFTSYKNSLTGLVSALSYTGTDFSFKFPAASNIPFVGSLWSEQDIPLKSYIDSLPSTYLYVIRFLAWLALLFSVVRYIRGLVSDLNGGGGDVE